MDRDYVTPDTNNLLTIQINWSLNRDRKYI